MNPFFRFKRLTKLLTQVILVAFSILFLSSSFPVFGQEEISKAPILLDGRKLFEVSESGQYTAEERAIEASFILKNVVNRENPPVEVSIIERNNLPVIQVNGENLLTVTSEDTPEGRIPREQAAIWENILEQAIARAQNERTLGYFGQAVILSLIAIAMAIAFSWALGLAWERWIRPLLAKDPVEAETPESTEPTLTAEIVGQVVLNFIRLIIAFYTLIYVSELFPQTRQLSRSIADALVKSIASDIFALGENEYSVLDFFILILLFIGLVIVAKTARRVLRLRVLSFTGLNRAAQETIALIANYTIVFIGTIVVLQLWGLDISSLTVFAGVLGVGIGLGIQGIAKEFVSGLVLIFERPIQVGDFVEVGSLIGTVERINVRSTEIHTLDDITIIVPNSRFLDSEVINWSHHSSTSRLKIPVGVAYGSNLSTVRSALIEAAKDHPDVLSDPQPRVFFRGFGDSSLDFDLLVWINDPPKQFRIKSDLYFRIEALLRHRDVEIPFPQRDLHVRSGNLPIDISPDLVKSLAQLSQSLSAWLDYQSNGHSKDNNLQLEPESDKTQ
ncbi:MAG: mechanosensitive ion channel family protein [Chroococcales cyanobacterium]